MASAYQDKSIADLMGELNKFTAASTASTENKVKDISKAYRPIDPQILQAALQEGGSLSSAQGLKGGDFWGMTPESFKAFTAQQVPLTKQIADATSISDAVSGNSATRKALEEAAFREQGANQQNLGTAADLSNQSAEMNQRQRNFDTSTAQQERQFTQSNAVAQGHLELAREKMNRELIAIKEATAAYAAMGGQPTPESPFFNSALANTYADNIANTVAKGKEMDLPGFENYAKAKAYGGAKLGDTIDVTSIAPKLRGGWFKDPKVPYKHLMLTKSGWYGFNNYTKMADGSMVPDASTASPAPIIRVEQDNLYGRKGSGGSGSATSLVNKYGDGTSDLD